MLADDHGGATPPSRCSLLQQASRGPGTMEHEQLLKNLDDLRRISKKLAEAPSTDGGRKLTADDRETHCFAFMEMELAAVVRSLRTPPPPTPSHGVDHDCQQLWLQELMRLANEIQHLMDMVEHGEADPPTRCVLLRRATRCFRVRRRMGMDLYSQIQKEAQQLHLAAEDPCMYKHLSSHPPPHAAEGVAGGGGDHLVGIKGPVKKLLRWLMTADTSLQFMAIVGPIGVGKTALAMEVHSRLRCQSKYFECCAVANFSRRREPVRRTKLFLRSILSQITDLEASSSHNSESETNEDLAAYIWKHLQYKRYFILIDDISKDSDWGIINDAFPTNHCGSRILLTTRNELIASFCVSNYDGEVHNMKPLSDSNSDRLLRTKAFGSMDYCPPDNLKLLCEEILKICRGIPLFITAMAEWLKQHQPQHEISAVPTEEQVRLLLKRFGQKLSFKYNDKLRPSLYLSMFPQGYVFDKNHFAMKWLEEGLAGIHSGLKVDMEQAKVSFTEMVDMNIISPVAENCGLNLDEDELCQWQVNPFMHKFLASKAAEKGYVFTSTTLSSVTDDGNMARTARRLALHNADPQLSAMLQQMDLSHTRSLLIFGVVDRTAVPLNKFNYLVVLDLQGWENLKDEDLLQICKMYLLTYLSVRRTRVSKLPPQIKELRILNTLDVSRTHITELPSELCELSCLRMLDLRCTQISQVPEQIVVLYLLRTLLIGGDGMINSDETVVVTKIPHTLMTSLQLYTLATVDLSEYPASFVDALGCQNSLRVLAIIWSLHQSTNEAYRKALRSSIKKCMELRSLTIHCARGCSMEFLGSLSDPPKELKKFKVTTGRFVSVPQWIRGLEHLAFLQITVCKLEPDDVKILGSLRCLKCLILGLEFVPEEEIVIESEWFSCLERFSLDCPVPWLTFKRGAMPMLDYLQLKICSGPANQVSAVPSGLTKLPKITEVVICYSKWCKNSSNVKMTVGAVRKQLARHPGQIDLVINGRKKILTQRCKAAESGTKNDVHQLMWARGQ